MSSDVCSSCGQPVQRTPSSRPEIICRECRWERRIVRKAEQQARKLSPSDAGRRAARVRWANTQRPADDSGLRPHGTKAALSRHYSRGEKPCGVCRQAENERQRGRAPYGTKAGTCSQCGKTVWRGRGSRPDPTCRDCRPKQAKCPPKPCAECGEIFQPNPTTKGRPRQRYCSKSCATKAVNRARAGTLGLTPEQLRERGKASSKASARRRRMIVATTWDGVTDEQILDRDRWMCWICKRRIGKTFKWPHPRSASIDHLVPLAFGGDDTAFNKKAAHLGCNMSRGTGKADEHPMLNFSLDPNVEIKPRVKRKPTRKPKPCKTCGELLADGKCDLHQPVYILECVRCDAPMVSQKNRATPICVACKTRPCVVPRCKEPVFFAATDWCAAHHHRQQKYGDVLADIPIAANRIERIEVAALIDPTRIWHTTRATVSAKPAKTGTCPSCELYPLNTCCGQAS